MIEWTMKKILGTKNERELKKTWPKVARINELESRMRDLKDEDFAATTAKWKEEVANGRSLDDLLFEAFALTREAARRVIGQRHFDVQMMGGIFLHEGCVAEMRTGEGKTLTATLPSYLNALSGRGVHVVTVNDYLAKRDAAWMGKVHRFLGLSVDCVLHDLSDEERQVAYRADITYGQNNEFGFDYLRDNMKFRLQDYVQRELNFAIVDEVDSILIDEARTPLIISGPTEDSTEQYYVVDRVIPGLMPEIDYTVDEKARSVALEDAGVEKIQKRLSIENLYDPSQIETLHHVEQGLRAHTLYKRDKDYVVRDGEVIIVDEFTGRLMPGRRWSDGLHQAIEAKEGVKIENENQTLATVSFQNYFRMYSKLSGMTGTADTEAEEFKQIYDLDVRVVPTNRPMIREDIEDQVYKTEREKFDAVVNELAELHEKGQPVLVGTVSIAKSEVVSNFLKRKGVPFNVLNAKQHEREAEIIAQAGRKGAVTISTNMAGRGTDILLGGNPEALARKEVGPEPTPPEAEGDEPPDMAAYDKALAEHQKRFEVALAKHTEQTQKERDEVLALGGLFILGTERHESRRIDNQLRGRAARQGDPGVSKFYLSLEDDLMRIFGSEKIASLMDRLGMQEGEMIEHRWLSKAIMGAQERVEGHNYDIRKNLLEYDDVMNQQRQTIYKLRRRVLAAGAGIPLIEYDEDKKDKKKKIRSESVVTWDDFREMVLDATEDVILSLTDTYCPNSNPDTWDLEALTKNVKENLNLDMTFTADGTVEQVQQQIYEMAEKFILEREKEFGEDFHLFLRTRYLATIDQLWKDHLLAMDHLRQGIGLRGYGQLDPKREYKKEGYEGFLKMLDAISVQFVNVMMRVQGRAQAEETARLQRMMAQRQRQMVESRGDGEGRPQKAAPKPATRAGPRVGRNDPCPCGSGKKYKKCHGAAEAQA